MRYRRADLAWALPLLLSAGLPLVQMLAAGTGWLTLLMTVPAYLAGRRIASLSLALWVFMVVALAGLAIAFWRFADPLPRWQTLVLYVFVASVLPWWVGRSQRLRAEQREREHGIVTAQARLRERARIAQDMHDSLGHELALIALRAGALELAVDLTGEQRRAAGELRAGAVGATERLHDIVRVLGSADAAADLQPAEESIDGLVSRAAAAGLRVRLECQGPAPAWSSMTGHAAHRVVEESLTNAARHAPQAPVTVTVAQDDAGTRIEVANEAPAQPGGAAGTGQGLIGLDERVRLAGGRLAAGPRPDGGWVVTAMLPNGHEVRSGEEAPSSFDLTVSKRLTRRRQLQTAALPISLGVALVAAIVGVQLLTQLRTGLPDDRYEQLRLGQPRAEVEPLLPPRDLGEAPLLIAEPPPPAGASCAYYLAGTLPFGAAVYRLCFADDVLVSKHHLERA